MFENRFNIIVNIARRQRNRSGRGPSFVNDAECVFFFFFRFRGRCIPNRACPPRSDHGRGIARAVRLPR